MSRQSRCFPHSQVILEFEVPESIVPSLRRIEGVWKKLRLMRPDMPLTEDFDLAILRDHADRILLVDVIEQPLWLRIESAGHWIVDCYGEPLDGRYVENIDPRPPLDDLWVQCMAAIKHRGPVFYRHNTPGLSYERIVFPLWGDSRVEKLVSAISETPARAANHLALAQSA